MGKHHQTTNIKIAFFLNLSFTVIEIIGGFWTNSVAILSDALHDLGDSVSLGLAWYLEGQSQKKGDQVYSYGYRRFSLLSAVINSLILLLGSMFILSEAIPRLLNPELSNAKGMFFLALGGILVNGVAALKLQHESSLNQRVVFLHLLEDVLGWVAVLVTSIVLLIKPIAILDPILSILITGYILIRVIQNTKSSLTIFLQAVPVSINIDDIIKDIKQLGHVIRTRHTHLWSIDGERHVFSTHLVVQSDLPQDTIRALKASVRDMVESRDIAHITIDIETEEEIKQINDPDY